MSDIVALMWHFSELGPIINNKSMILSSATNDGKIFSAGQAV